ncbi:PadR family transcriptional regulator [Mycobacterium sp. ACS1612]|uniref:PadR family transcriptional regulator n=1 Tax=Mycobacterium sp. ACS1612 TaxID=1834117 RepID=UPI0007FDDD57|nr:PadR family transcriptional regulator [Mycobacterium sp. ACS1612]OBF33579.1 PadR family transcriptional regulator [Mycobacterium sp. ACS1612]
MALGHAVLAALLEGEASGYQLAKRFDVSVANFWSATPQQLYRELDRLEEAGLVEARLVRQQRRPDKRVFTLTEAGRAELNNFTSTPAKPVAMRDELLVKLQAVDVGDAHAVTTDLTARLDRARVKLARYDRLLADMLDGCDADDFEPDAERIGPYLTLMGGRMYEQANIGWCTAALDVLSRRLRS